MVESGGKPASSVLLTVEDVAEYLKVSHATVKKLLRAHHLPYFKIGGEFRFDRYEIDRWIAERELKD